MAETIPGGRYLRPDGKTWVDANGDPVTPAGSPRSTRGRPLPLPPDDDDFAPDDTPTPSSPPAPGGKTR